MDEAQQPPVQRKISDSATAMKTMLSGQVEMPLKVSGVTAEPSTTPSVNRIRLVSCF